MRHLFRPTGLGLMSFIAGITFGSQALAAAPSNGFRVLHHEAVKVTSQKGVGANERMSFDAYGRRFELTLAPNDRIRRGMSAGAQAVPLQGSVEGIPNSWVRVTRTPSGLRGMVFDGQQLYAIEPASEVAAVAVQPLNASGSDTVVYRLSDALMPVETMACEIAVPDSTPNSPPTAADAFHQMSAEMATFETAEAAAIKQLRIGVVGDFEFVSQFTVTQPEDAIVARMNIVDGIFSAQLDVKVSLATPTLFRTSSDPFTKSKASELLDEVKNYRNSSQAQKALGLTHLMTGRNLDTTTVGIAYVGGLCNAQFGSSLSQSGLNTTQAALIAAHEIGHNFGAPHDGEGACASAPAGFLMASQLNGSDQLSACSVQQITPYINNSSCLTTYAPPDAGIVTGTPTPQGTVGTPLMASFSVQASGDGSSANVNVTVSLPPTVTLQSVSANGGTCTSDAVAANCSLGTLAAGDTRQVDLNVTPTEPGAIVLGLQVSSSNDLNTSNNSASITINAASNTPVTPPVTTPPAGGGVASNGGGGGGGGRMDLALLGLMGFATVAAAFRRRVAMASRRI